MTTAVCITTYNEAATIAPLVWALRDQGHAVIVSDGGSADNTAMTAAAAGASTLEAAGRPPIADCLMRAFRMALYSDHTRIAVMDAGGSHDPADLPRLLAVRADVVIGSRFVPGAEYVGRAWRAALSRLASLACNVAQPGAWHRDWTSGYRVYSRRAVEEVLSHTYRASMHAWQMETLAHLGAAGMSIVEAPITYRAGRSSVGLGTVYEATNVWLHIASHVGWRRRGAEEIA